MSMKSQNEDSGYSLSSRGNNFATCAFVHVSILVPDRLIPIKTEEGMWGQDDSPSPIGHH